MVLTGDLHPVRDGTGIVGLQKRIQVGCRKQKSQETGHLTLQICIYLGRTLVEWMKCDQPAGREKNDQFTGNV